MGDYLLELSDVTAGYGEAVALSKVSLSLAQQGSLAILGRNGVGKTSLLLTIMGLTRRFSGKISFNGREITGLPSHQRARAGLGWVPQERGIFPTLTVKENLFVAARPGAWDLSKVYHLFPRLLERQGNLGHQLSGGEQQMLSIGRSLMTNPSLLLLDEPTEGLAPIIVEELTEAIRRMRQEFSQSLILVEQHVGLALGLTEQTLILERGVVVHAAPSADLIANPAVLDRYLALELAALKTV